MDRWRGLVQIGMTDLGGNLDILASFRPGEKLLLDLVDDPEAVKQRTWAAHELWFRYFDEINGILQPGNPGYTAWAPLYSADTYYMLQCDFCYMISPKMFDEFVRPELAATCKRLTNPFYHLDGKGQLPHLDSLLRIPELKGVQWIPGAGAPGMSQWPDVYRKIKAAGRRIQLFEGLDTLDAVAEQTGGGAGIALITGGAVKDEGAIRERLTRWGVPA
jgi:5-methyltetrahydrofolate--homocysteine methyltransferase